jgi:hypothetical protein
MVFDKDNDNIEYKRYNSYHAFDASAALLYLWKLLLVLFSLWIDNMWQKQFQRLRFKGILKYIFLAIRLYLNI